MNLPVLNSEWNTPPLELGPLGALWELQKCFSLKHKVAVVKQILIHMIWLICYATFLHVIVISVIIEVRSVTLWNRKAILFFSHLVDFLAKRGFIDKTKNMTLMPHPCQLLALWDARSILLYVDTSIADKPCSNTLPCICRLPHAAIYLW